MTTMIIAIINSTLPHHCRHHHHHHDQHNPHFFTHLLWKDHVECDNDVTTLVGITKHGQALLAHNEPVCSPIEPFLKHRSLMIAAAAAAAAVAVAARMVVIICDGFCRPGLGGLAKLEGG